MHTATPSGRGLDVHGCPISLKGTGCARLPNPSEGDWMHTAAQFLWKGTGCTIVTHLLSQGTCCLHARGCFIRWHSGRSLYAHTHVGLLWHTHAQTTWLCEHRYASCRQLLSINCQCMLVLMQTCNYQCTLDLIPIS